MQYLELLQRLHQELNPVNYLEIGCRYGASLALSRSPSLAIDPNPEIGFEIECEVQVFPQTSDEFFEKNNPIHLLNGPVDLAFIDGMHLAEFVLRDFANLEKFSHSGTVVVIDDVLPTQMEYATRQRQTQIWCGDVYRIVPLLRQSRPDLRVEVIDIDLKGACIVWGLNPQGFQRHQVVGLEEELDSGAFKEPGIVEIRRQLRPLLPEMVPDLIQTIQQFRRQQISTSIPTHY